MIRPEDVVVDKRFYNPPFVDDILCDEEIVDAPPGVARTGIEAVGPPGVLDGVRIEVAEGVHVAS